MTHAKSYPGTTVGQKVTAALASPACPANTVVPCYVMIDPSLASFPAGTLPTPGTNQFLVDFRSQWPENGVSSNAIAWNGVTQTNSPASGLICIAQSATTCTWTSISFANVAFTNAANFFQPATGNLGQQMKSPNPTSSALDALGLEQIRALFATPAVTGNVGNDNGNRFFCETASTTWSLNLTAGSTLFYLGRHTRHSPHRFKRSHLISRFSTRAERTTEHIIFSATQIKKGGTTGHQPESKFFWRLCRIHRASRL